jgi:hypothetical protein
LLFLFLLPFLSFTFPLLSFRLLFLFFFLPFLFAPLIIRLLILTHLIFLPERINDLNSAQLFRHASPPYLPA